MGYVALPMPMKRLHSATANALAGLIRHSLKERDVYIGAKRKKSVYISTFIRTWGGSHGAEYSTPHLPAYRAAIGALALFAR